MKPTVFEQLETIKQSITNITQPDLLFEMNRKYRELEAEAQRVRNLTVTIYNN